MSVLKTTVNTLFLFLVTFMSSQAATYYVDKSSGNDDATGTSLAEAWETIRHACSTAVAGDVVLIVPAVYSEEWGSGSLHTRDGKYGPLYPLNSGEIGAPIVFEGYDSTVVYGGSILTKPVLLGNLSLSAGSNQGHAPITIDNGKHHYKFKDLICKWGYPSGIHGTEGVDSIWITGVVACSNWSQPNDNGGGISFYYSDGGDPHEGITIDACTLFHNFDYGNLPSYEDGTNVSGIHLYSVRGCEIMNCRIYDQPFGNGIRAKVYDTNWVAHNNEISGCIAGIYWGVSKNVQAHHNLIYDCGSAFYLNSFATITRPDDIVRPAMWNNTIDNCVHGLHVKDGDNDVYGECYDVIFINNLITNSSSYAFYMPDSLEMLSFDTINHNCYWNSNGNQDLIRVNSDDVTLPEWKARTLWDDNAIASNPEYQSDYSILSTSTCAEAGLNAGGYDRYIGAFAPVGGSGDPHINLDESQLSFSSTVGGPDPTSQSFTVSNTGGGTLNWSISDDAGWLSCSPLSGDNNYQTINVYVSASGLTAGTYNGTIMVSSSNADNSPQTIAVQLIVAPVHIRLEDESDSVVTGLSFSAMEAGANPDPQTFTITNSGGGTLEWSVSDNVPWMSCSPLSGTSNSQTITVYIGTTTLEPATYSGTITVSSTNADNSPQTINVQYQVLEASSNFALGRPVTVSGSYSGYSADVLTDGVIDPDGETATTWASDESYDVHWVEIDLGSSRTVRSLALYWAFNTFNTEWMISRTIEVQRYNGSTFETVATIQNDDCYLESLDSTVVAATDPQSVTATTGTRSMTVSGFTPFETSRLRIYQPSAQGPSSYDRIMWLTEVEVYYDDITPPTAMNECY